MHRLLIWLLVLLLVACTPVTVIVTATNVPISPPAPADPTPTPEPDDWVELSRNPGADLDGEPITDTMVSPGNPQVTVQHPPAWILYGVPVVRWPSVYRRQEGLPSYYEYNVSFWSGTVGLEQFEVACPGKCIIVATGWFNLHTTQWTPGSIYFSASLWPTSGHSGACAPTVLPQQSPPAPIYGSQLTPWSAVWLVTSGSSDWYMRVTYTIPWPTFGADSIVSVDSIEVKEVGPGYGSEAVEIRCQ